MAAAVLSQIVYDVSWQTVDGSTTSLRFAEAEDAAIFLAHLSLTISSESRWLDRIEVFTSDDADRGISAQSEWIATPGAEAGQLWERVRDHHSFLAAVLTPTQWERMCVMRNRLGSRRPGLDGDPRGPLFSFYFPRGLATRLTPNPGRPRS